MFILVGRWPLENQALIRIRTTVVWKDNEDVYISDQLGVDYRPSVFANWLYTTKIKRYLHSRREFYNVEQRYIKVRFLPSCRDWEIGAPSSLMNAFQKDGSQVLRKPVIACKITQSFNRFTSQRTEIIYS